MIDAMLCLPDDRNWWPFVEELRKVPREAGWHLYVEDQVREHEHRLTLVHPDGRSAALAIPMSVLLNDVVDWQRRVLEWTRRVTARASESAECSERKTRLIEWED